MTPEDIEVLLRKEPFEAFRIKLSNGDSYEVMNPRWMVVMKSRLFLALPTDRWVLIPWRHVVSAELLQTA